MNRQTETTGASPGARELLEHAGFLEGLARALVRDDHAARDLVQETWAAALEKPPRHSENLKGWLATVLRRKASRSSVAHESVQYEEPAEPPERANAESESERRRVRALVSDAVFELDEPARRVVLLRFYDGLPPRAIAERLGIPVSTVHTRLQRAFARLRGRLDRSVGRSAWAALLLTDRDAYRAPAPGPDGIRPAGLAAWATAAFVGVAILVTPFLADQWSSHRGPDLPGFERGSVSRTAAAPAPTPDGGAVVEEPATPAGGASGRSQSQTASGTEPGIAVQVLDHAGRPAAEAWIFALRYGDAGPRFVAFARADEAGRLRFEPSTEYVAPESDPIFAGRVGLYAIGDEGTPSLAQYVDASVDAVELVLGPAGGTVQGRVRDADGVAIADATIDVGTSGGLQQQGGILTRSMHRVARTDADGFFLVDRVPRGPQAVSISKRGYAPLVWSWSGDTAERVDVVLYRGATVEGVVRDAQGRPVPGASVWQGTTGGPMPPPSARAGEDGSFALPGLASGPRHLFARSPHRSDFVATQRLELEDGVTTSWDPRLQESHGLQLELVGSEAQELAHWAVSVRSMDGLWNGSGQTDAAGELSLYAVPDSALAIQVWGPVVDIQPNRPAWRTLQGVETTAEPLRVVVPTAEPFASLRGTLVDADGHPHREAWLTAAREGEETETHVSVDALTGRFQLDLPAGRWTLLAFCSPFGSAEIGAVELVPGEVRELDAFSTQALGYLTLDWDVIAGDRFTIAHVWRGRAFVCREMHASEGPRIPVLAGDLQLALYRDGVRHATRRELGPGAEIEVDVGELKPLRAATSVSEHAREHAAKD